MNGFLVGAQLYSVRSLTRTAESLKATLASVREMGYTTCQLSGQNREIPVEFVRDALAETGVRCVVTHNSLNEFENDLPALIARHQAWSCQYAGIGSMPEEFRASRAGFEAFARRANAIGEKLKDAGITFVYHNHAFEFNRFDGALGMDILFDHFSENVQFELDSYWIQAGGCDPVKWFRKVDGRMDVAHFKDMRGSAGFDPVQVMVPVGEGNIDFMALKKVCEETGVRYAEVEQDNASDLPDPLGEMRVSLKNLREMGFHF